MAHDIFTSGIYSEGYGMIAKSVMRNKDLSVEAKAIYAYLVSFSGAGLSSFPSTELILSELKISHKRYLSHRKKLEDFGYISITRIRTDNGFSKNLYEIKTDISVHSHSVHERGVHVHGVSVQNDHTISNSLKSNSLKSNSINTNTLSELKIDFYDYKSVIDYLNDKAGTSFKNVESHKKFIRARYNEGYSIDDFKKVIDNKVAQWISDPKMEKFLRPSTLFASKFDMYLNEKHKSIGAKSSARFTES